jgi:pyruvate dehydrogenase E1 component alpha subunit
MKVTLTEKELADFEEEVAQAFLDKKIRAPVHLAGGNEAALMGIFAQYVNVADWICTAWRSHYHCLLKGVSRPELFQAILDGRSINLCFPEHRIISSAICGGIAPIAVGIAAGIKRKNKDPDGIRDGPDRRKVVCFLGDMAARMGVTYESMTYAVNHELPVLWVIEDNGKSVETYTEAAWGGPLILRHETVVHYKYNLTRPHVGVGKFVAF